MNVSEINISLLQRRDHSGIHGSDTLPPLLHTYIYMYTYKYTHKHTKYDRPTQKIKNDKKHTQKCMQSGKHCSLPIKRAQVQVPEGAAGSHLTC